MPKHIYRCPLRWSDMDAFGHVNNVVFLRYLEEARIDFLFRLAPGEGRRAFSEGSVVARHEVDYLRPLVHRHEPVTVESWVTSLTAASFTIAYEVKDEDTVYVRASTVVVPYILAEGRPRRLSAEEREFLQPYVRRQPATGSAPRAGAGAGADRGADRGGRTQTEAAAEAAPEAGTKEPEAAA